MISKPAFTLGRIVASPEKMKREEVLTLSRPAYTPELFAPAGTAPPFQYRIVRFT